MQRHARRLERARELLVVRDQGRLAQTAAAPGAKAWTSNPWPRAQDLRWQPSDIACVGFRAVLHRRHFHVIEIAVEDEDGVSSRLGDRRTLDRSDQRGRRPAVCGREDQIEPVFAAALNLHEAMRARASRRCRPSSSICLTVSVIGVAGDAPWDRAASWTALFQINSRRSERSKPSWISTRSGLESACASRPLRTLALPRAGAAEDRVPSTWRAAVGRRGDRHVVEMQDRRD